MNENKNIYTENKLRGATKKSLITDPDDIDDAFAGAANLVLKNAAE